MMKKYNFLALIIISLLITVLTNACKSDLAIGVEDKIATTIPVTHISIPYVYNIKSGGTEINLGGIGFLSEDIISFVPKGGQGETVELPVGTLTESGLVLTLVEGLKDGAYDIRIKRGELNQLIGKTFVNFVFNPDIPDQDGMTVKGTVFAAGKGIADVVVSDGEVLTKTDANGIYYLPSTKKNGYVFISVPSNYEVSVTNTIPRFFKTLTGITSDAEIRDFELFPVNNENHVVAFLADIHLANRNDDIAQFQSNFLTDINETFAYYESQGKKFYGLTLGDQSWDQYWYANNFKLAEYLQIIKDVEFPIYNVIGNHDYDPYVAFNDWQASSPYRNFMGPTYYSVNIGKVHYVILDNMVYTNMGGSNGVIGDREYNSILVSEQLDWLQKDLAYITDKSTPIVVAMHVPLYSNPNASGTSNIVLENGDKFISELAAFNNVKVLTGHYHVNYRVQQPSSNIMEYNIGAVSATWWWTGRSGYAGNHICKDGSPGGYAVLEAEEKNQKLYYKSIGFEKDYQFRSYDLNKVLINASIHTPNASAAFKDKVAGFAGEYATEKDDNQVLLNIWGYQDNWKITVTENGNELPYMRVRKKDPLHIISYDTQRLNVNADPTSSFITNNTAHMFLIQASSATSTLEITVEDDFGNIYSETMERPKAFNYSMR
ncbi:metallophosphoesterase [Sphingobacterium alkalisoli]|uniref:Metallophosphoesterase n=1 Tax=Sphingobacterium alkalisoli TaxID=1874115 RepID=A0A4U0H5A5_9SPHI|nr:calcineurin-like phosphoesterase family protein [Sphingobacterium alkalisoli]TJY66911.1 metallophosphoesterase [Sphingobacterium alkalisoli]GGH13448.1 serine/threonine protein phosphatase [Sphingobacterium alkalisoli]